jgi:hypothetical protein
VYPRAPAAQVDQIYHLACPASPVHYKYNPVKTIKARSRIIALCGVCVRAALGCADAQPHAAAQTNVMGTLNMLGLAKRVKARHCAHAPVLYALRLGLKGNPFLRSAPALR